MAVAMTDGPLGLEAMHVWAPDDGGDPITLNDRTSMPRFWFDSIGAFKSLPDADDNRQPRTARVGESVFPSLVRGRTFTPQGRIMARSPQELRQMQALLHRALGERDKEGLWASVPNAAYGDNTHYWQTRARVIQLDCDDDFQADVDAMPSPWQLAFTLGVRQSDPRWTWTDGQSAGPNSGQVTVTNLGSAPAELVVTVDTITGPATVTVFNDTVGAQLKFVGLPSGTLIIDSAARTALIGVDAFIDAVPYLDTLNSNWWDRGVPGLQAGVANTIRRSGGGTDANITVTFKHTSW